MTDNNRISLRRWPAVWQRNRQVWQKTAAATLLGDFGEPFFYLIALGYGLGFFIGTVEGMPYLEFLASGIVCVSATQAATFECLYASYTRLAIQHTWQSILATPLNVPDIVIGEILWAATRGLASAVAVLIVAAGFGFIHSWQALWVLPLMFWAGACFAAMALVMTALAHSYDFFLYYNTLFITPMILLSGVFFPLERLPVSVQMGAQAFPLVHAIKLTRSLIIGQPITEILLPLIVITGYTIIAIYIAIILLERRLYQ